MDFHNLYDLSIWVLISLNFSKIAPHSIEIIDFFLYIYLNFYFIKFFQDLLLIQLKLILTWIFVICISVSIWIFKFSIKENFFFF